MRLPATPCSGGIQIGILVQPRASRNEIVGIQNDRLKIRLTAPPVDGVANKACLRFLAKTLNVSNSQVTLINGQTGRNKTIFIQDLNPDELWNRLQPFLKISGNSK